MTERFCPRCELRTHADRCPSDGEVTLLETLDERLAWQLRPGDVVDERYRVDGAVARGGFGAVYVATHTGTGQRVALKLLAREGNESSDELARFDREAKLTAALQHPNTIRVFDVGETVASVPCFAMEWLRGRTLQDVLKALEVDRQALSEDVVAAIAADVLRSLAHAHEQGGIH